MFTNAQRQQQQRMLIRRDRNWLNALLNRHWGIPDAALALAIANTVMSRHLAARARWARLRNALFTYFLINHWIGETATWFESDDPDDWLGPQEWIHFPGAGTYIPSGRNQ